MKRSRLGPTLLLLLPMLMSCGIAMDATPRDIPASQRLLPLENDVTARIDWLKPHLPRLCRDDRSLKSVRRGGTPGDLLTSFAGPTEDESVAQPALLSHQIRNFVNTKCRFSRLHRPLRRNTHLAGKPFSEVPPNWYSRLSNSQESKLSNSPSPVNASLGSRRMATRPQDCSVYSTSPEPSRALSRTIRRCRRAPRAFI